MPTSAWMMHAARNRCTAYLLFFLLLVADIGHIVHIDTRFILLLYRLP